MADPEAPIEEAAEPKRKRSTARLTFGVLAIVVMIGIASERCASASFARDPSAVQIIQIYAEGMFALVFVIGLVVALYVAIRPD